MFQYRRWWKKLFYYSLLQVMRQLLNILLCFRDRLQNYEWDHRLHQQLHWVWRDSQWDKLYTGEECWKRKLELSVEYSYLIQFDDPFYMPTWRKYLWSIFFFVMVAAADIGNIIGNVWCMLFSKESTGCIVSE